MSDRTASSYAHDGTAAAEPAWAQIHAQVQALTAGGRRDEAVELLLAALAAALRTNREQALLLERLRRSLRGTRSEKISAEQLALLLEQLHELDIGEPAPEPEAEAAEDEALRQEIAQAKEEARARSGKGQRPRRQSWRAQPGVERCVHHVEVPSDERICVHCGREQQRIGADITHTLELVPARFIAHEYHRDKYACGRCKQGVTTAPGPDKVIPGSAVDASVLAQVTVSKYVDHMPLERQHRIYNRHGIAIPVSTMTDWIAAVGERVQPLADLLMERVLRAAVARTDASGIRVIDRTDPNGSVRGTMWCFVGDDRHVVFRYTPTAEGESGPWRFLRGRQGPLQADASNTFDRLFNGRVASAIEVGCWAHARRDFVALRDTDCRVAPVLQWIGRLYRIEELANLRQLTQQERVALRVERSAPVLGKLKRWLLITVQQEPPSSDLAKAAAYCLNHWKALTRFLEDGRLELDNNLCERQLRDLALGRKNYLFAGSHEAAHRAAAIYSLMRTCAQHGVPPLPYLTDVLRKLAGHWPEHRLEELLPDRWQLLYGARSAGDA